jgi:hypothetical protein
MCWRLCENNNCRLRWQLNNSTEQTFLFLPIAFQDFFHVVEGEQQDFFD